MLLLIDNYDSFTWNLVQTIGGLDPTFDVRVVRNDEVTVEEIDRLQPERILISPGPCTPAEGGISNDVIAKFGGRIPIFGVCLGHQCIGHMHGMTVRRADVVMHGKTSLIHHDGRTIFAGLPNPFVATRYHSLIVERSTVPEHLFEVSAWTEDGVVMGLRRRWETDRSTTGEATTSAPLEGVQFHPESFLTTAGPAIIANFLGLPQPALSLEPGRPQPV